MSQLCNVQAYYQQIHYPDYTWITFGNFEENWWRLYKQYLDDINCTSSEIDKVFSTVLNRALILLSYPGMQVYIKT